jgi:hypothetical protein
MSITLDLPQELERELSMEATRLGLSLSEYALRLLSRGVLWATYQTNYHKLMFEQHNGWEPKAA